MITPHSIEFNLQPSPIQEIHEDFLDSKGIQLWIKRDDLLHPAIQGNKWRKLKYNLVEAKKCNQDTLLTFGGYWSNHIYAVAAAGKYFGFKTIGIIRGEEPLNYSSTLKFAKESGMILHFTSRKTFNEWKTNSNLLPEHFKHAYLIPEGGSNIFALKGVGELIKEIPFQYDFVACAMGTGGTLAGLSKAIPEHVTALGFSSLKGDDTLTEFIENLLSNSSKIRTKNWKIIQDYSFGGYAKTNSILWEFIYLFHKKQQILLEPIYTGKLVYGLYDLITKNYFPKGSKILLVHSGGIQGLLGFEEGRKIIESDPYYSKIYQ